MCLSDADADGAALYAKKSLEMARGLENETFIGVAHRVLGQVASARDEQLKARRHFDESWRIFEEAGDVHELAKTAAAYGEVLMRWGELEDARDKLEEAAEIFRDSSADLRLQSVQALLDRMPRKVTA